MKAYSLHRSPTRRAVLLAAMAALALALPLAGCSGDPPTNGAPPEPAAAPAQKAPTLRAGFDVDDTLLFSSPAFDKALAAEGVAEYSEEFWRLVNGSDRELSPVKKKTAEILKRHRDAGGEIYVITARKGFGGETLKDFLFEAFGVPPENVFFEARGKTERIKALQLDVFYGDSDSDITAAQKAGAKAVRILRSPKSSYTKKYNPGKYGEEIVEGSED